MNKRKTRLLSPLLMAGALLFASCMNDDYDFDQVDTTIGLGGDGLELPASSTSTIPLADILDLETDGIVVEAANGDYMFIRDGGDVAAVHPYIDRITVASTNISATDIYLKLVASKSKSRSGDNAGAALTAQGEAQAFTFVGSAPSEIVELSKATVNSRLTLVVDPTALSQTVSKFDKLSITLPSYMTIDNVVVDNGSRTLNGSTIEISDVQTNRKLTITASVVALDFKAADKSHGELTLSNGKVSLSGTVSMSLSVSAANVLSTDAIDSKPISSQLTLSNLVITSATGRFNPSISLANLGDVAVTGIPNFLTDANVVVDLYNPQILLSLSNDMDVSGLVDGKISSTKDGKTLATVNVPGIKLGANGTSNICICRKADGITGYDQVIEVENLSDLIRTIPDNLKFSASATADASSESTFELGHEYTVKPSYTISAPIAFAEDANIVYNDSIDDMHDDLEDLDFADNSYISIAANATNGIPANLTLSATPIGVNGQDISSELDVNVEGEIKASPDGVQTVTSQLTVTITPKTSGSLKKLDKIMFKVVGSAKSSDGTVVTGYTLNAQKHVLVLDNIKVRLVGKLIGDFN